MARMIPRTGSDMSAEPRIDVPAPERAGLPRVTLPADLQSAREARRWSRLDVARLTKFQVRQIAALEEGHFDQLPGRAFVRAALRNYAAVLEMDASPLLATIGGHAEPAPLTVRLRYPRRRFRPTWAPSTSLPTAAVPAAGSGAWPAWRPWWHWVSGMAAPTAGAGSPASGLMASCRPTSR